MVTTMTNNRVNLEQVCSLNIEQSRLLQKNGQCPNGSGMNFKGASFNFLSLRKKWEAFNILLQVFKKHKTKF